MTVTRPASARPSAAVAIFTGDDADRGRSPRALFRVSGPLVEEVDGPVVQPVALQAVAAGAAPDPVTRAGLHEVVALLAVDPVPPGAPGEVVVPGPAVQGVPAVAPGEVVVAGVAPEGVL